MCYFQAKGESGRLDIHSCTAYEEDALVLGMGFATNSTILPALFEARQKPDPWPQSQARP